MVVKLNLIVDAKYKTDSKQEKVIKHYVVFAAAAAFLLVSAVVIILGSWRLYSLSEDKKILEAKRVTLTQNIKLMQDELGRLDLEAADIEGKLNFMLEDIPAVELMTSLDPLIPDGVYLESLNITKTYAEFKGIAIDDENVTDFVKRLSKAPFTISVEVPIITPTKIKNKNVRSFTIKCAISDIKEILKAGVVPEGRNLAVSGDETL